MESPGYGLSPPSLGGATNHSAENKSKKRTRRGGRSRRQLKNVEILKNMQLKINSELITENHVAQQSAGLLNNPNLNTNNSLPSTSKGNIPVLLTPVEESLANTSMRTPISPVPSTSKLNITNLTKAVSKNDMMKGENYHPDKDKYNLGRRKAFAAASCSIQAFSYLKRNEKNIWKPLSRDKNIDNYSELSETEYIVLNFDIKSIKNPSSGFYFRKRTQSCKYINLKSFSSNIPVIFVSKLKIKYSNSSVTILNKKIKKLTLNEPMSLNKDQKEPLSPSSSYKYTKKASKKISSTLNRNSKDDTILIDTDIQPKKKKQRGPKVRTKVKSPKKQVELNYPEYLNEKEVEQGLTDGSLVKGFIRINQRNNSDAYVNNILKGDNDYLIKSVVDQNRALDGDEVILRIKPEADWEEGRKTGIVVYISKMVHSRSNVGKLLPLRKNQEFASFIPRDKRFPKIRIPKISWPTGFETDSEKFAKNLFMAKITEWTDPKSARGLIIENIGISGDLKIENLTILKSLGLDHEPFTSDSLKYLPKLDKLQDDWLKGREDLRKDCIFSIDPLTARDLDDAISCKTLPDGNLEIGVHIADVSHFLKEGTELDKQVESRATTIYMVDNVYHMLPVELCMSCSLLPAKDKLSFSVFWTMTSEGEILSTRFAKTIINSCAQLAYEHAQAIIEDANNFDASNFPNIMNGYKVDDIKDIVLKLYSISENLRKKRFENGALRIDQVKLSFNLDPVTGEPISYFTQEMKEANRLIEEFMLLANISVAEKIYQSFPDIAFLRLHEPPKETMMKELKACLESVGIHVDITSSKTIQSSLLKYTSDDFLGKVRSAVLSYYFAKPMVRARYFCPALELAGSYSHYALNIPLYTHFTSPIRRYADIMVHRLLAAGLGMVEKPTWDPSFVGEVANRCNLLKHNAKKAQEESTKLYLSLYITKNGPFVRLAAVVDVRQSTFDVLVLDSGEIVRIFLNEIEGSTAIFEEIPCLDLDSKNQENIHQRKYWRIKLQFAPTKIYPAAEIMIELFTTVNVELRKCLKKLKLKAKLLRPTS